MATSTVDAPVDETGTNQAPPKTNKSKAIAKGGSGATAKKVTAKAAPKATAPTPTVTLPKTYVFGGAVGSPEMGANSRRLWSYLKENVTQKQLAAIRKETLALQEKEHPADRFIRWQRIVTAATKLGATLKDGAAINQALVRRLQAEDKNGKTGRDTTIKFTV